MKTKLITYLSLLLVFTSSSGMKSLEIPAQTDWTITIKRTSINSNSVTGELYVNGEFICHTLELPWKSNKSFISSIPSGEYSALLRYNKNDKWRLLLENVPNRTGIQIHIGNYPSEIEGCVLVGDEVINVQNKVSEGTSTSAYKKLKKSFYGSTNPTSTPNVNIKVKIAYNTGRTKLICKDGRFWKHAKRNLWISGSTKNKMTREHKEYKRDLKYIYMGTYNKMHYRIPLHGGELERKFKETGAWEKSGQTYRREN